MRVGTVKENKNARTILVYMKNEVGSPKL